MFGVDNNLQQASTPEPAIPTPPNPISGTHSHEPAAATPVPSPAPPSPAPTDDLLALKQKALTSLEPMVGKLNQSPEEKFKTLMMLIQASDNQNLVKDAYAAAEQITDETARAQALIDVVNEINYFTSKQS